MSLRTKLLLLALSTLILPWAGWQLVRQFEGLLREGQAQAQLASAEALARALAVQPGALPASSGGLFVHTATAPITLDGYDDEWRAQGLQAQDWPGGLQLTLARAGDALYLLAAMRDSTRVRADAHWPQAARADQLLLGFEQAAGEQRLRVASAAPGPAIIASLLPGVPAPRMVGEWQEDGRGYRVELRLPRGTWPLRLGVQALDFDDPARAPRRVGMQDAADIALLPLIDASESLQRTLAPLVPEGMRARLLHPDGWVLAQAGNFASLPPESTLSWWRRLLYRNLSRDLIATGGDGLDGARLQSDEVWQALSDKPAQAWRSLDDGRRLLLATAVPVRIEGQVRGALLLERPSEVLLLTQQALTGLMLSTLLVMLVIGLSLFLFAGRLGQRIRQLSRAADAAIAREGRSGTVVFPQSGARDELGDLSRSFARLLGEVTAYTEYLHSLAGKLSHELHTPIAVVRSSLENLESQPLGRDAEIYLGRARVGVDRLAAIVRAMSESSRVERAIAAAESEDVDLRALLEGCAEGYRPLLAPRRLDLMLPPQPLPMHVAPDLIVQALDKLVDNARGFCPESGWVLLALAATEDGAEIAVANAGSQLPEAMRERLFDSLVSLREGNQRTDGSPHLGLGLHIVRLIAQLHDGSVRAANLPDGNGVEFRLRLRALPRRRPGADAGGPA